MPVYYPPTGWCGTAKGRTDDGKFIFEASYGKTYYVKNTDVFEISFPESNNVLNKAFDAMGNTICPYRDILNKYFVFDVSFEETCKAIVDRKIPDGIKPEAPAVEYFNKYKETFMAFVNAYFEQHKNQKELIKNVCGDNFNEVRQSKWNDVYVRHQGKKILKNIGIHDDIIAALPTKIFSVVCQADLTFGEIRLFDIYDEVNIFMKNVEEHKLARISHRVNGFYLCCSYIKITKPNDYAF